MVFKYKKKIENEIAIINDNQKSFEINYLTIMLLGVSGVGKTTLINKILNVHAKSGGGSFVLLKHNSISK